jgi:multicomponent Na+:H+ antiporter subunit F
MTVITTIAFVLVGLGAVATLARLLLGPTLADRVLTLLSSAAAVHAVRTGDGIYLEVMLVVAVVGFLGTAAVARFIERQVP